MIESRYVRTVAIGAVALALAACTPSAPPPPETGAPAPLDCGAEALQGLVGQPVTGEQPVDLRVGDTPVAASGAVRVIAPGQMVTQDYRPDRLNLDVSGSRALVRAWCG